MNYTTNISLPKPLADLAKQKVKEGYYTSLSEVIRASLRYYLLQPQKKSTIQKIPTNVLSKKSQIVSKEATKEYKSGKLKAVNSLKDLE